MSLDCCNEYFHQSPDTMKPPFDIAADLDTPVSAWLKLASLNPRYLLESVEGGERLARYSFLGFGDALELRLDRDGFVDNGRSCPRPDDKDAYLDFLRERLAKAPQPAAGCPGSAVQRRSGRRDGIRCRQAH